MDRPASEQDPGTGREASIRPERGTTTAVPGAPGIGAADPEGPPFRPYLRLALVAWLVASPVWIVLRASGGPPDFEWTRFPYLDRRWLLALYWLSVGTALALPWLFYVLHRVVAARPATARGVVAALRGLAARSPAADRGPRVAGARSALLRGAGGLLLATVMFGPPWHTDLEPRPINHHEVIHWSGLQAIARGYAPYLGPASVNYGPGLQLLIYSQMRATDQFTVPGFRAGFGLSLWISAGMLFALAFALLRPAAALLSAALFPALSPAVLWTWADGALHGYWGWANPLRTLAPAVLALATVGFAGSRPGRRPDLGRGFVLGLLWGVLSYVSQENLAAGGATLALLFVLLLSTGTLSFDRLVALGSGLAGGFAVAWAPAVAYYGWLGRLGEFWYAYTLIPGRFLRGYANTAYPAVPGKDPWLVAFYATPVLTVLLALAVLVRTRTGRFAAPLDRDRLLVLAPCVALLASYPSALLRADAPHFVTTLLALPVAVGAALFHLPRCRTTSAARWRARLTVLVLAGLAFWPVLRRTPGGVVSFAGGRIQSLGASSGEEWAPEDEVARRFGRTLAGAPQYRPHLELMRRIKEVVGEGPVFVQVSERDTRFVDRTLLYAGGIYFLANLEPGPIWLERSDMVANEDQLRRFRQHFLEHVDQFDFVVSLVPSSGEIRIFQQANPGFTTTEVEVVGLRVWIYGGGWSRPSSEGDAGLAAPAVPPQETVRPAATAR